MQQVHRFVGARPDNRAILSMNEWLAKNDDVKVVQMDIQNQGHIEIITIVYDDLANTNYEHEEMVTILQKINGSISDINFNKE
ncbi:hypothetical protein [Tetragenococcus muriaticus]|uniref:Uncharacterized protein n=2 Tax=Tetragenococcus TaxID=51668 RepID=A0A091C704_9ENTE|nr:hypothetical protein [Tetragenococcus muriaticus]KFN91867.1 hypothetical protein TMU3MR103_0825 [Tetragenococcus muriaticus 3MR10-3]